MRKKDINQKTGSKKIKTTSLKTKNSTHILISFSFSFSTIEADVIEKTNKAVREAALVLSNRGYPVDSQLLHSAVEHQIQHALGL